MSCQALPLCSSRPVYEYIITKLINTMSRISIKYATDTINCVCFSCTTSRYKRIQYLVNAKNMYLYHLIQSKSHT